MICTIFFIVIENLFLLNVKKSFEWKILCPSVMVFEQLIFIEWLSRLYRCLGPLNSLPTFCWTICFNNYHWPLLFPAGLSLQVITLFTVVWRSSQGIYATIPKCFMKKSRSQTFPIVTYELQNVFNYPKYWQGLVNIKIKLFLISGFFLKKQNWCRWETWIKITNVKKP